MPDLKHLLAIHGVSLGTRPVWSYHDHSGTAVRDLRILGEIMAGRSVAYASEAGTPMISDPGLLVRAAVRAGLPVTAVPGVSAAVTALTLAGLPTDRFLFLGFLPSKAAARRAIIAEVAGFPPPW